MGVDAGYLSRVKNAYEVLKLTQVNFPDVKDKANHLAAIHKLPREAVHLVTLAPLQAADGTPAKIGEKHHGTKVEKRGRVLKLVLTLAFLKISKVANG